MASGFHFQIRSALRGQLQTVSGYPGDSLVAWDGIEFNNSPAPTVPPAAPAVWLRESFMPSSSDLVAFGTIEAVGLVQFSVFYQSDRGVGGADDLADTIIAAFKPGLRLASLVSVTRATRAPALAEPGWIHIPVSVYWRAFRANT